MGKLFGTDGIRGVVNAGLDADLAYKVGLAAAEVLASGKKAGEKPLVTIGKDTRISGDLLKGSLIAGLCTAGADVLDLGTLPTPGVAWVTVDEKAGTPVSSFPPATIPSSITASRSSTARASSCPTSWRRRSRTSSSLPTTTCPARRERRSAR